MFVLTAAAQPVHLQPIEKEGEAEWETVMSPGDKLKGLCNHRKGSKEGVRLSYQSAATVICICTTTKAPSPPSSRTLVLSCIN